MNMTSHHSVRVQNDTNDTSQSFDPLVGRYRWALIAGQAAVLLYFWDTNILTILLKDVEPLCWPYFQSCWQIRFDTTASVTVLMLIQAGLIVVAASALAARYSRTFWVTMVILNAYVFAIMSLDYRLRGNQFYMLFWLNAVVLFWPAKRWAIPLIIISFYFWAGTLKLNFEWLSGAVLYHGLYIIPLRLAWIACVYAVVLEMIVIWGLLSKRAWIRWLALCQLALFHFESLSQIHWFYPLLMAALLSWFVIDWISSASLRTVSLGNLWRGRAPRSAYILLAIFATCQLPPYLYHGNKSLTGQGRIFALDMLEARQVCDVHAIVHHADHTTDTINLLLYDLPPRKICDPVVYYDRVTNLCRANAGDSGFTDADFVMHARRTTDTTLMTIVDEPNFCSRHDVYRIFANNSWMK
jgi:hypothetical protein